MDVGCGCGCRLRPALTSLPYNCQLSILASCFTVVVLLRCFLLGALALKNAPQHSRTFQAAQAAFALDIPAPRHLTGYFQTEGSITNHVFWYSDLSYIHVKSNESSILSGCWSLPSFRLTPSFTHRSVSVSSSNNVERAKVYIGMSSCSPF